VLGPRVFEALHEIPPGVGGEVQLADALQRVIDGGGRVLAVPLGTGERRHDVGDLNSYCAAFVAYALRDPRVAATVRALVDAHR
jgi:UTP--glucose-1-phosphate uridylyltransferase